MTILSSHLQLHRPAAWEEASGVRRHKPSAATSSAVLSNGLFESQPSSPAKLGAGGRQQHPEAPPMSQVGGMVPLVKLLGAAYEDSIIALSASAVAGLAVNPSNAEAFREAGGVPSLVWLLKEDLCQDVTSAVLWATTSLARNPSNCDAFREAGGIAALLSLLEERRYGRGSSEDANGAEALVQTTAALAELAAGSDANQEAIIEGGGLGALQSLLQAGLGSIGGVSATAVVGMKALRAVVGQPLSRGAQRCSEELGPDVVPLLLQLLEAGVMSGSGDVAEEATATVEAIANASPELARLVFTTPGCVAAMVGLLRQGASTPGVLGAVGVLGTLAEALGSVAVERISHEEGTAALMQIAQPEGQSSLELLQASYSPDPVSAAAAKALQQIYSSQDVGTAANGSDAPVSHLDSAAALPAEIRRSEDGSQVQVESVPALVKLLKQGSAGFAIVHAAGALADLAVLEEEGYRQKIYEAGAVPPVVAIIVAAAEAQGAAREPPSALPHALRLVAGLARNKGYAAAIQEAGAAQPLVQLLRGPWALGGNKNQLTAQAVEALQRLAENKAAQDEIREADGITALVSLLPEHPLLSVPAPPRLATMSSAAAALRFLALNSRNRDVIREAGGVPRLISLLHFEPVNQATVQAAAALTNLSRKKRSNMIAIADAGGIPPLVHLLWQGPCAEVAMLSLGALTNLAYTSGNRDAIREAGGIPALVALLHTCCGAVEEHSALLAQVVAVLGNLAGTSRNRDAIREAGALPLVVALVEAGRPAEVVGLAVSALTLLALSHSNAEAIRREGGIPALVACLTAGAAGDELTFKAAEAIRVLSSAPANRTALRDAGALPALTSLLGRAGEALPAGDAARTDLLVEVILALRNLVTSTRNQDAVRELGGVARLVEVLRDPAATARVRLHGVSALINLFAHNGTNREVVRGVGGVQAFVGLLQRGDDADAGSAACAGELTAQAALALGFLARSDANREAIRVAGGIPLLVQLLKAGPGAEVTLCAVDALRHVVAAPSNAKALLMAGGVSPLLRLLEAGPEHEVTLQSLWVLKVLARSAAAAEAIRTLGGLPLLAQLLDIGSDSEATVQAAAVLRDIADVDTEEGLTAIVAAGAVPGLVRLLRGGGQGGAALGPTMAAAALANLAQSAEVRDAITAADGIAPLVALLAHPASESQVSVKAAAALLNLANGDKCRARIIDAGAIPVLVELLATGADDVITTWSTAVLASLARSDYGRKSIEAAGVIPVLVELLGLGPKSGPARQAAAALQELGCGTSSREAVVRCGGVDALLELYNQITNDSELLDCCTQALVNVSRYPPARNRLREYGALEMLMRRVSSVRVAEAGENGEAGSAESSPASSCDTNDGLLHVPTGGWSWQQLSRQRDLSRLSFTSSAGGGGSLYHLTPASPSPSTTTTNNQPSPAVSTGSPFVSRPR